MSRIRLAFTCPVCAVETLFVAKKPTHFESTIVKVRCLGEKNSGCESTFQVAVDKTKEPRKSKIDIIGISLSEKAEQISREKKRGTTHTANNTN